MRQMIMGFRLTQMLHAAARLGIADRLREGPLRADTLAQAVDADPEALARLLRALATVEVFRETPRGEFELTPRARLLCSDAPGSLLALARLYGEPWLWHAYGETLHAVRTGEPGFEYAHDEGFYSYLAAHPDAAATFDQAMSGYSAIEARALVEALDLSHVRAVLDVGGGEGMLATTLLRAYPALRATVFDLAGPITHARGVVADAGLGDRCECVAGDFFVDVPPADGIVVLKSVLHNWDDAKAGTILHNCRRAMQPDARLVIMERVIADSGAGADAALFDINMLVVAGGRERTESEYRALLAAAGFRLTRVHSTASPLSLIEATHTRAR